MSTTEGAQPVQPGRLSEARVLVVDDEQDNGILLARLLEKMGVTHVRVEVRADALPVAVAAFDPDLILMDLHVGNVDGLDALHALAATDPGWSSRRAVLVTGEVGDRVNARVRGAGVADMLVKPFTAQRLRQVVEGALAPSPAGAQDLPTIGRREPSPGSPGMPDADFRALFEGAPGSFLVLDADLVVVAASDAYLRDTRTHRDSIVGRDVLEVVTRAGAVDVARLAASLARVRATGHADSGNVPIVSADGSQRYIIHGVDAEGSRRSRELQATNDELRAANSAKADLVSRVSHELRTPLTSILGFATLLQRTNLDDEQREWTGTILRAGRHLLELISDTLDIAALDGGHVSMSIEPVPVDPLVRDVVELVQPLADTRGISITTAASSLAGRYVAADNQRLRQVLINLLSNAIKYNRPQGSVTVAVQQAGPDRSRISVSDTGAGLSPDQLTRLFVPFERLDANLSGIEGTGLGLALSRNLVTDMGGTLDVSSHVGVGSTFSVELHAVEPAAVAPDRAPESSQIVVRAYGTPKRVLYVEDMVANARLVAQILTRRPDVTLIPAMLGGIALELAREHVPDLVLLDLHLPDMEGLEVLRRLRADPHTDHIPVVILSADTTRAQTSALLEAGASRYLTKPIDVAGFLDVVDEVLVPLVSSAGSRRG